MISHKSIHFLTIIVCCFYCCRNQTINNKIELCPQNSIDAITLFSNNTLLIFQKNHVWIKLFDSIKTPQLIQNHWSGRYKPFQSDFDDIIYNPKEELTLTFKAKYFWVTFHSTNDRYLLQNITNYFETIHDYQTSIDAAILVEDSNKDCLHSKCLILHLFKDKFLWCYRWYHFWHIQPINEHPIDVTTINPNFPTHLDAAFSDNYFIYLIKGLYYYKILLKRFPHKVSNEDLTPHLLYVDIIKCKYNMIGNVVARSTSNQPSDNHFAENSIKKSVRRIEFNEGTVSNEVNMKPKNISMSTPSVIVESDNLNITKSTIDLNINNSINDSNAVIDTNMNATIDSIITSTTIDSIIMNEKIDSNYSNITIDPIINNATIDSLITSLTIDSNNINVTIDKFYSNTTIDSIIPSLALDLNTSPTIDSIITNSTNNTFKTKIALESENNESLVSTIEPITQLKRAKETVPEITEKTINEIKNDLQDESEDELAVTTPESVTTIKSFTTTKTDINIDSIINVSINSTAISIREFLSTNDFEIDDTSNDKLNLVALITFIAILLIISVSLTVCYIKIRIYRRSYDVLNH